MAEICCLCLQGKWSLSQLVVNNCPTDTFIHLHSFLSESVNNVLRQRGMVCFVCSEKLHSMYEFRAQCIKNIQFFINYVPNVRFSGTTNSQLDVQLPDSALYTGHPTDKRDLGRTNECNSAESDKYSGDRAVNSVDGSDMAKRFVNILTNDIEQNASMKQEPDSDCELSEELTIEPDLIKNEFGESWEMIADPTDNNAPSCTFSNIDQASGEYAGCGEMKEEYMERTVVQKTGELQPGRKNIAKGAKSNTREKTYQCSICKARFSCISDLKIHMRIHTGEKSFQCNVCEATFTQKAHLKLHVKTHTGDKPFQCKVCAAKFVKKGNLKVHMKTHTGERPYKCNMCESTFIHNGSLKLHLRTHTGDKPYLCNVCEARFANPSVLNRHMRIHTGVKPYQCNVCEAKFAISCALKRHMRTHTGEKPFQCKICEAKFIQNSNLTVHMRTHTGEKPYKCNMCEATFTQNGSLKLHLRTHTGDKPYLCSVCEARYADPSALRRHMRTHTVVQP